MHTIQRTLKNLFLLFGLLVGGMTFAQEQLTLDNYKATMDGWLVDFEKAHERSVKEGKPIMANFTGSDWCGWCIRLKKEVFETKEFKKWAEKNVILLELDYPRKMQLPMQIQEQNKGLAQAFQVSGFPTIWVFNVDHNSETNENSIAPIAKSGYVRGGPDAWISDMQNKMAGQ